MSGSERKGKVERFRWKRVLAWTNEKGQRRLYGNGYSRLDSADRRAGAVTNDRGVFGLQPLCKVGMAEGAGMRNICRDSSVNATSAKVRSENVAILPARSGVDTNGVGRQSTPESIAESSAESGRNRVQKRIKNWPSLTALTSPTMIHPIFAALTPEFGCPGLVSIYWFVAGIVLHRDGYLRYRSVKIKARQSSHIYRILEFRKTGLEMLDIAREAILWTMLATWDSVKRPTTVPARKGIQVADCH
ncbi:hypothetical protein DFH09DRAFT_1104870 [Mycena vulgaris]|nr:hypothetical protein DFH09DRAFT_1104870 [Mycena vulgaris]